MKKITALLLAGTMVLALAACGQSKAVQPQNQPRSFEVSDVQGLAEAGVFSEELEELDADMAFALYRLSDYGVERENLAEAGMMRSAGATCEEAAVLVLDGEDVAEKVLQAMEDYIAGQIESNENYRPGEIPKLKEAVLEARGDRVVLVVANDVKLAKEFLEIN